MRPSSSSSDGLFEGIFGRGPAAAETTDVALLQAMLDVEAALAAASARVGLVPAAAADAIAACCNAERYDVGDLGRAAADSGTPVLPLVTALTAAVAAEAGPDAAGHVHRGATSQDVLDTATMVVAQRVLRHLLADLAVVAEHCAQLAGTHATSLMTARTLLQPALPTTFGLKAAGWLTAIDQSRLQLATVRDHTLAVQLGGAAGTLAALDGRGPDVTAHLATALGLVHPVLPWHADRTRVVMLAAGLALSIGSLAKVGRDVTLLCQAEVAEVSVGGDPNRGASSTMPHKRNPVAAVTLVACGQRSPGLLATLAAGMPQEHERAAGGWQAEWETLRDLLRLAGTSGSWARDLMENLEVDPARMRANLDSRGGFPLAESVTTALTASTGRGSAHHLVEDACRAAVASGTPLRDVLLADPQIAAALGERGVDEALDPVRSVASVRDLLGRALSEHDAVEARLQGPAA